MKKIEKRLAASRSQEDVLRIHRRAGGRVIIGDGLAGLGQALGIGPIFLVLEIVAVAAFQNLGRETEALLVGIARIKDVDGAAPAAEPAVKRLDGI